MKIDSNNPDVYSTLAYVYKIPHKEMPQMFNSPETSPDEWTSSREMIDEKFKNGLSVEENGQILANYWGYFVALVYRYHEENEHKTHIRYIKPKKNPTIV